MLFCFSWLVCLDWGGARVEIWICFWKRERLGSNAHGLGISGPEAKNIKQKDQDGLAQCVGIAHHEPAFFDLCPTWPGLLACGMLLSRLAEQRSFLNN